MRIVYCIAGTRHSGGMERVLANKANWLVERGHEVHVVTTDQCGEKSFFSMDPRIFHHDLNIGYELDNGKSVINKLLKFPIRQFRHRLRLSKLLKSLRADIVISMGCNESSIVPSVKDGSKKILEVHFSRCKRLQYGRRGIWGIADRYMNRKDKLVACRYDRFVVLTLEDLALWGSDMKNICVIPNARTFMFDSQSDTESKTVLAVGRFSYQKGFELLIDAWSKLSSEFPDWHLRIVGGGELKDSYARQIEKHGLTDSVTLVDAVGNMAQEYTGASILAMTSRYEGLPMVLLEAQAAGLPIVSFACKCGPRDIVDNGVSGYLVNEGDVEGMSRKLSVLMSDPGMRKKFGAEAYRNSENYTMDAVMAKWTALFSELYES